MKIMVAGIGTEVGKTVVAAIVTTLLEADYWKPIQCGELGDSEVMQSLIDINKHRIHPSTYALKAPLSPHHAARLENVEIEMDKFCVPTTERSLVIEGVGGIYVPLTTKILTINLFKRWNCKWIVVSRHYVGSINHTLLTLQALKWNGISVAGIVFNGEPNSDSEEAILQQVNLPVLGRVFPETEITVHTIQRYAKQWQPDFMQKIY